MIRLDAGRSVEFCDGFRRRDFLHAGSLTALGLGLTQFAGLKAHGAVERSNEANCILLMLVGGPSQLDTWDMKRNAPAEIRGPYKAIRTNVPGIEISEIFPRMARHADKYAILRAMHHTAAAVHDTGHQMMQTGRLFQGGVEYPHAGCVVSKLRGPRDGAPPHVLLPRPIGNTGGNLPHGQSAGFLGKTFDPFVPDAASGYLAPLRAGGGRNWREMVDRSVSEFEASRDARLSGAAFQQAYTLISSERARAAFDLGREPEKVRERYGMNRFGQSCLLARRLIEAGVRFVTVNMFETVFEEITWDIHGSEPFSPMSCYRDVVGPMFDMAYTSLLEELSERGLLESTMVAALGEFGRTPRVNPAGGRDHWPQCWSVLMAGGGVRGGQVVGASDETGSAPKDRPTSPAEVAATIYHSLGIDLEAELPGPLGKPVPVVERGVQPIRELFSLPS